MGQSYSAESRSRKLIRLTAKEKLPDVTMHMYWGIMRQYIASIVTLTSCLSIVFILHWSLFVFSFLASCLSSLLQASLPSEQLHSGPWWAVCTALQLGEQLAFEKGYQGSPSAAH